MESGAPHHPSAGGTRISPLIPWTLDDLQHYIRDWISREEEHPAPLSVRSESGETSPPAVANPPVANANLAAAAAGLIALSSSVVINSHPPDRDCEDPFCDAADCERPRCSEPGFIRQPGPPQRCAHHRFQNQYGRGADDDFLSCPPECRFFDPDATEPDLEEYQTVAEETALGGDEAEVQSAARQLLSYRNASGGQYGDTPTRAHQSPNYGETRSAQAQEPPTKLGKRLISDLGPRWAPPISCKRPRCKPQRF